MHLLSDSACATKMLKNYESRGSKVTTRKKQKKLVTEVTKKFIFLW